MNLSLFSNLLAKFFVTITSAGIFLLSTTVAVLSSETLEWNIQNSPGKSVDYWREWWTSRIDTEPTAAKPPNGFNIANDPVGLDPENPERSYALDVWLDPGFHSGQPEAIEEATKLVLDNMLHEDIWSCARRTGVVWHNHTEGSIKAMLRKIFRNKARGLYITRFWYDRTPVAGVARVEWFQRTETHPDGSGEFWISLNSHWGTGPIDPREVRTRAGLIFHEMLHNLGLRHPLYTDGTLGRDEIVYRLGDCLSSHAKVRS